MIQNDQNHADRSSITETTATDVAPADASECANVGECDSTAAVELDADSAEEYLIPGLSREEADALNEEIEQGAGNQMLVMGATLDRLQSADWLGSDSLAEAAGELREVLGDLDNAYANMIDADYRSLFGTEAEDGELQDLIANELAALNRRLAARTALAFVRDAAQRVGQIVLEPGAARRAEPAESDDAVEH